MVRRLVPKHILIMEDLYNDEGDSTAQTPEPESTEEDSQEPNEEDKGEITGLLPKEILMGKDFKVGEEVVLKITAIHDDEIQVAYATGKSDKSSKGSDSNYD